MCVEDVARRFYRKAASAQSWQDRSSCVWYADPARIDCIAGDEIFWREIFSEIFLEVFQKFHDGLWVQAV